MEAGTADNFQFPTPNVGQTVELHPAHYSALLLNQSTAKSLRRRSLLDRLLDILTTRWHPCESCRFYRRFSVYILKLKLTNGANAITTCVWMKCVVRVCERSHGHHGSFQRVEAVALCPLPLKRLILLVELRQWAGNLREARNKPSVI